MGADDLRVLAITGEGACACRRPSPRACASRQPEERGCVMGDRKSGCAQRGCASRHRKRRGRAREADGARAPREGADYFAWCAVLLDLAAVMVGSSQEQKQG